VSQSQNVLSEYRKDFNVRLKNANNNIKQSHNAQSGVQAQMCYTSKSLHAV